MTGAKDVWFLEDSATARCVVSITAHQLRRPFTWGLHKLLSPDLPETLTLCESARWAL